MHRIPLAVKTFIFFKRTRVIVARMYCLLSLSSSWFSDGCLRSGLVFFYSNVFVVDRSIQFIFLLSELHRRHELPTHGTTNASPHNVVGIGNVEGYRRRRAVPRSLRSPVSDLGELKLFLSHRHVEEAKKLEEYVARVEVGPAATVCRWCILMFVNGVYKPLYYHHTP